jgi:hypothetical protein
VKLTRLVVESANAIPEEPLYRSSDADESDDGSLLVVGPNVKDAGFLSFSKIFLPFDTEANGTGLLSGLFAVRLVQVSYYADKRSIRTGWAIAPFSTILLDAGFWFCGLK